MQRTRDVAKLAKLGHWRYPTPVDALDGSFKSGLHSIKTNNRWFDFFYEDRGADATLVTFSAALPSTVTTYPRFSARPRAADLGMNFLGFADAAQGSAESLPTFWHLSTNRVDSGALVPAVIQKLKSMHPERGLLFFGASAGGFAALNYSARFPGSTVLAMNPRVNVMHEPKVFPSYAAKTYPGRDWASVARTLEYDLAELYAVPRGNSVVYLQNLQDHNYIRHHYAHFQKAVEGREEVKFITGNWGDGHVPPPRDVFMSALRDILQGYPVA